MGGGDLNLKKSWHPHTMKNQEKVWKAEQAKSQEENKLKDLRREIEEEKTREELKRIGRDNGVLGRSTEGDKKLDWMYKNSTDLINRDEYLLGRKIDKSFEILQAEEQQKEQHNLVGVKQSINHVEHECVPFSIRAYKNLQNSEQVDLQRKVMEDPLMLIKQREMESRRKILENPVKLKELHRILKTDEKLQKDSKKSKKSKKNKKSKKKHKKHSESSASLASESDSDSDLDSKLAKKLKCGLLNKDDALNMGLNLSKLLDSKYEKISQELDKAAGKSKKHSKSKTNATASLNSSDGERYLNHRQYEKQSNRNNRKSRSESNDRFEKNKRYQKIASRSPIERNSYVERQTNINNPFKQNSSSLFLSQDGRGFEGNPNKPYAQYRKRSISRSREYKSPRAKIAERCDSRDRTKYIRPKSRSPFRSNDNRKFHKQTRSRSRSNNRLQNRFNRSRSRDRKSPTSRSHIRSRRISRSDSRSGGNRKTNKQTRSRSRSNNRLQNRFNRSRSRDRKSPTSRSHIRSRRISRSDSRSGGNRKANKQTRSRSRSNNRLQNRSNRFRSRDRKSPTSRSHIRSRRISRSPSRSKDYSKSNKRASRSRSRSQRRNIISPIKPQKSYKQFSPKSSCTSKLRSSKLSDEEKQAKLREMMSNAAWREEERTEVVRKHREAYAKEEQRHNAREFDKDFLNKEVKKAMANQTSVGSRLRANLNNIQRTSAAMNSSFARK